jgi:hypothetical protein
MAGMGMQKELEEVALRFQSVREGWNSKSGGRYPEELWEAVARLSESGVSERDLRTRCGIGRNSILHGIAQGKARLGKSKPVELAQPERVKSLELEPCTVSSPSAWAEVLFPSGIVLRLDTCVLSASFLSMLKSC